MRRAAVAAVGLGLAAAFYLLLIDTASLPELLVMCGVVVLAAGAFLAAVQVERPPFAVGSLVHGWRAVARIPADAFVVTVEAVAQLAAPHRGARGRFRTLPFDGSADQAGMQEYFGSLAPNQIVLGCESDHLVVHELRRRP